MAAHTESGSVRIIGGKWRSRIIRFDDAEGLRPTTDRIRETVFNWLQPYIHQSRCLDLFAGSGVLGFETLSRGARELVFIEQNKKTSNSLRDNINRLQAENVTVYNQDALAWLQSAQSEQHCNERFDLVFLDPPFHAGLLTESCMLLNNSRCLAEDAIIYVEYNAGADIEVPENWLALKEKTAGQVVYRLFENRPDSDS